MNKTLIENIKNLTLCEANNFLEFLEKEFKLDSNEKTETIAEKNLNKADDIQRNQTAESNEFKIILKSFVPDKKLSVLKVIKNILNLGLKESKDYIESLPKLVKTFSNKEDFDKLSKELVEAGAILE